MPELPAVEFTRKLLEENCLNSIVEFVRHFPEPDELIFTEEASKFFKTKLVGCQVIEVGRWGKQLWLKLRNLNETLDIKTDSVIILIHLGMTAFFQFNGINRLKYESSPSNSKGTDENLWPPKFTKFIIKFEGKEELAFCDARRFGKIDILTVDGSINNLDLMVSEKFGLGFDPLKMMPSPKEFHKIFEDTAKRRKRINMKTILLDQSFVAGIGNWMADDILLMAGILPQRPISSLTDKEIDSLHAAIKDLTEIAVAADADKSKFPKNWLFHIRWSHGSETLSGLTVKHEKISGRSTFWIPELQK